MLISLRGIGLGVSIDFYRKDKDKKFVYFILCWVFWIISVIFAIVHDIFGITWLEELLLVLNVTFVLIGFFFYIWGFFQYYMTVSSQMMLTLIIIFFLTPFLVYLLLGFNSAIAFSLISTQILLLSVYIVPPIMKRKFKEYMGKSTRWYYTTVIVILLYFPISAFFVISGYRYGLYTVDDSFLIILYYIPPLLNTVLIIVLLIHIEYTISTREKFELKDSYSHDLGNILQAIYSSSDLINMRHTVGDTDQKELDFIRNKCSEASTLIRQIREL